MNQFKSIFKSMPPVTKNLIIINFIIWLACALIPQIGNSLHRHAALHFYEASDFNLVQLVTYMFLHGGFFHVFFNMFTLFMFGILLEYAMGSKRFLLFYMACGIGAALIQEAVWALTLPDLVVGVLAMNLSMFTTVGASGSIYGVLLAFAMLFPNRPLYFLFIPVPIKAKWMVLIWGGMELLLGLSGASDGIAHFAHLGGMIFGFMLIVYWKKKGMIRGDIY